MNAPARLRRHWPMVGVLLSLATLAGAIAWRSGHSPPAAGRHPLPLRILVTDELSDVDGLVLAYAQQAGTTITIDHAPAATLADRYRAARHNSNRYDAVWLATTGAGTLPRDVADDLPSCTTIMTSPVVLGLRSGRIPTAESWSDLVSAERPFTFGMVDQPGDVAAGAILTMAGGLAQAPAALGPQEAFQVSPALRELRRRQTVRAATPGDLATLLRSPSATELDAVVTTEAQIHRLNTAPSTGADHAGKLTVVVPDHATVQVRYDLCPTAFKNPSGEPDRVGPLKAYLLQATQQQWITRHTYRRAANAGPDSRYRVLEIPRNPDLINRITAIYFDQYHYPSRVVFALDMSGSMAGNGQRDLVHAFHTLDSSLVSARGSDVQVLLAPFAAAPGTMSQVDLTAAQPQAGLRSLARQVTALHPAGGTGIYAALAHADDTIAARTLEGDERVTTIVLITDGHDTTGGTLKAFLAHRRIITQTRCTKRTVGQCQTPVYPVLVGGADTAQMQQIAHATGGQVRDARHTDLSRVLLDVANGR
jgi:Ca-activated chloride channel family protein